MRAAATLVIDASVAVKWVVTAEVLSDRAQALLTDALNAGKALVGPPHLTSEVANALYRRVRSQDPARHLTANEAEQALGAFLAIPITAVTPGGLYERAFAFARLRALPSLYDALYVVLAQLGGTELWTADERLIAALGSSAPWVHALATYPIS